MEDSSKEFNCIFCKETFENKEELQIHFRKHGDPKFNQSSKTKVRPTNEVAGEKSNEEMEMISCDVCTELFPTISKAITHKHKVHPDHDAKYFCPWCGKLFTMKHLYNKHISANHTDADPSESEEFPCDCCEVTFNVASAMLYHNKFFHRQDTDLPSIGQSKKLMMTDQNSIIIYYCPFCGQEYNNKVNLHKHMTDDHSDENQSPDDVLRCPLCDAIFYHLDAYEHHLIFHSVEDMYSEKNEMVESVTEFSLESVPPIMEKVENLEPKETSEGAMELDDLLQMAMGKFDDDANPKKSKKHKKHKKSKKAAITLDEFLNMNKDVFGEGIDFQGIEEVPSQVVAKNLKVRKKAPPKIASKMSPKEIEKLQKQGIVIKMKSGSSLQKQMPNKVHQISNVPTKINQQNRVGNTPNEVLSKLMNQSNSQIKIVRKSAQNLNETGGIDRDKQSSPENIEVECDLIPRDTSSDTETDDKPNSEMVKSNEVQKSDQDINDKDETKASDKSSNTTVTSIDKETNQSQRHGENKVSDDDNHEGDGNTNIEKSDIKESNENNPLKNLKNVSQHITVKPVSSPKSITKNNCTEESYKDSAEIQQKETGNEDDLTEKESKEKQLNALKHLSHLITVKPSTQPKTANLPSTIKQRESSEGEMSPDKDQVHSDEDDNDINSTLTEQNKELSEVSNKKIDKPSLQKSVNALKNMSNNNVTIKPMGKAKQSTISQKSLSSDEEENNISSMQQHPIIQGTARPIVKKLQNVVRSPELSPKVIGEMKYKESSTVSLEDNKNCKSSADLLKNLTNITAKPVGNTISTNNCTTPINPKITQTSHDKINQEIEIFNIDDSDSDNGDDPPPKENISKSKVSDSANVNQGINAIKNLSKHLTIKSIHEKPLPVKIIKPDPDQGDFTDFQDGDSETESDYYAEKLNVTKNKTNTVLQNTLKNLSKHITIKSRNSSPSSIVTSHGHNNEDSNERLDSNDAESDNDSNPGQVKITEVNDNEFAEKQDDSDEDFNENMVVQSPPESGSDNEDYTQDHEEDMDDIESKIQTNTLSKAASKQEESFRNIGKGITIKSLSEKKSLPHSDSAALKKVPASLTSNLSKELSIKPFRQGNKALPGSNISQQPNIINQQTMNKNTGKQVAKCSNQSTSQKMCASTNQTNTVNKEVTVKTFQTKTVIQEITTTVTKTIKTVNQSMKQEVQASNQACTQNVLRKVQGMRPHFQQPSKNYQGVVVRHAAPSMGAVVRGSKAPMRPTRPAVKVSNQLVPVRPGTSMHIRPQAPRMPAIRGIAPTSTNSPKPVKISPNIVNSGMKKRPAAPETTGPFSCFKRPKESLISEMSSFNSPEDDSMVNFASSQMTKSNVMNTTRMMKGNTVVSSTQMKSEVSSCSQQLSKLNNVTGLRIVKTSQVKQASHVEERQEANPAKRGTQEAIEKLQKMGMLVKKPRVETNDEDYSDDEYGGDQPPDYDDDDFDD